MIDKYLDDRTTIETMGEIILDKEKEIVNLKLRNKAIEKELNEVKRLLSVELQAKDMSDW